MKVVILYKIDMVLVGFFFFFGPRSPNNVSVYIPTYSNRIISINEFSILFGGVGVLIRTLRILGVVEMRFITGV